MRSSADTGVSLRRLVAAGLLIAMGAVLGYVESALVPPLPVPGVRLGLANIAVVLALATIGARGALTVSLGRVLVSAVLAGSLGGPATILALSGSMAAWAVMGLLARDEARFSIVGWSVGGAAAHVCAQLVAASFITGSAVAMSFAPVSLLLALGCGLAIGYCSRLLVARLPLERSMEVVR